MNSKTNNLFESYNINLNEDKIKESVETGNSVFELKFDCSNEETFGIGEEMINPIADTLREVIEKIEIGRFDGPIMDVNGNKIGSFGIGYEGVETGLSEKEELNKKDSDLDDYSSDVKTLIDGLENIRKSLKTEEGNIILDDYLEIALDRALNDISLDIDEDVIG